MSACRVCGRPLDDLGTCICVSSTVSMKPPVAETLRSMAARYQTMADDLEAIGRFAEAEGNRRLVRDFLVAAEELEARLLQVEMGGASEES